MGAEIPISEFADLIRSKVKDRSARLDAADPSGPHSQIGYTRIQAEMMLSAEIWTTYLLERNEGESFETWAERMGLEIDDDR